jgi:hypothetical protein
VQEVVHLRVPPAPPHALEDASVEPGEHGPSPAQMVYALQLEPSLAQVRDCVPQRPHARISVVPGEHSVVVQALKSPHAHVLEQVRECVPPVVQGADCMSPGVHTPSPLQLLKDVHVPVVSHTRTCVPQRPQEALSVDPGVQPVSVPVSEPVSMVEESPVLPSVDVESSASASPVIASPSASGEPPV